MTRRLKTILRFFKVHLSMNFMNRFVLNPLLLCGTSLIGMQAANATDQLNDKISELTDKNLAHEDINASTHSRSRHCNNICEGPRGDRGCRGPRGPNGISGLTDIAAYEKKLGSCTPVTVLANTAIDFGTETVHTPGTAISSAFPFNQFQLEPGDYQIDVGVTVGNSAIDFQLQVLLDSKLVFAWPVAPSPADPIKANYVEFSTIIKVQGSTSTLEIFASKGFTYTTDCESDGNDVANFINIIKVDQPPQCL